MNVRHQSQQPARTRAHATAKLSQSSTVSSDCEPDYHPNEAFTTPITTTAGHPPPASSIPHNPHLHATPVCLPVQLPQFQPEPALQQVADAPLSAIGQMGDYSDDTDDVCALGFTRGDDAGKYLTAVDIAAQAPMSGT